MSTDRIFGLIAVAAILLCGAAVFYFVMNETDDDFDPDSTSIEIDPDELEKTKARRKKRKLRSQAEEALEPVEVKHEPAPVFVIKAGETKIVGRCVTGEDQTPVEGVTIQSSLYFPGGEKNFTLVKTHKTETKSDEDGRFLLEVPGHGAYRLECRHPEFAPVLKKKIRAGDELEIELSAGASLFGEITDLASQKAIAGARVTLKKHKSTWSVAVTTDEFGHYRMDGVFPEALFLSVEHPHYVALADHAVTLESGKEHEEKIKLDPGKRVKGAVTDPNSAPVEAAMVKVGGREVTTDLLGQYEVVGLARTNHQVEVMADGYLTYHQNVNLAGSRDEATVDAKLSRGGTVRGIVMDDTGNAIPGIEVKLFESWGSQTLYDTGNTRFVTETDEDGNFEISGLQARSWSGYRARARAEGFADAVSDEIKIKDAKKPVDVRLILGSGGSIRGRVEDQEGNPIIGAKLSLNPSDVYEWGPQRSKSMKTLLSDDNGNYRFDRLAPRRYRISAIAPGHSSQYKSNLEIKGAAQLESIDFTLNVGESLQGTVKNEDGEGLADAWVTIHSKKSYASAQTDAEGNYVLDNVSDGPFTATARLGGYSFEKKKDVYPEGGRIDFELKRNGYVWGILTDKSTKKPITKYRVELQQKDPKRNNQWRRRNTQYINDPTGKFKIYAKDGRYRLVITSRGYIKKEQEGITISLTDEPKELEIELTPGGSIEGWMRDRTGAPMAGVAIYSRKIESGGKESLFVEHASSERDGYFFIDSLEAGNYDIAAFSWGRMPVTLIPQINVTGGEIRLLTIDPKEPVQIYVTVRDDKDKKVRGNLQFHGLGNDPVALSYAKWKNGKSYYRVSNRRNMWINSSRETTIRDLAAGSYRVVMRRGGYETFDKIIDINRGVNEVSIVLKKKRKKKRGERTASTR